MHALEGLSGKKVLVTGHLGFKGTWICLFLEKIGVEVIGIGTDHSANRRHFDVLDLNIKSYEVDITKFEALKKVIKAVEPEVIIHAAAQPLVGKSYSHPIETWNVNVTGTQNVLEAARLLPNLESLVIKRQSL